MVFQDFLIIIDIFILYVQDKSEHAGHIIISMLKVIFQQCNQIAYTPKLLQEIVSAVNSDSPHPDLESLKNSISVLNFSDLNTEFRSNSIGCMTIYEDDNLSLNTFYMAAGSSFPLHDHPNMLGIVHLLSGEISYTAYNITSYGPFSADFENCLNFTTQAPFCTVLTPAKANIHSITALTNSVIFDVFMPNYIIPQRICSFFQVHNGKLLRSWPAFAVWTVPFLGKLN